MNGDIQNLIRKFKELLLQEFGSRVHKVLLFGSYASGTYGAFSDIDVAVVLEGPMHWKTEQQIFDLAFDAEEDSGKLLSVTVLSREEFEERPIDSILLIENITELGITVE